MKLFENSLELENSLYQGDTTQQSNETPNNTATVESGTHIEETEPMPNLPNEIVEDRGNTVGNIVNGGYVALQDDWLYYRNVSDGHKLYKIRIDGTDRQLVE